MSTSVPLFGTLGEMQIEGIFTKFTQILCRKGIDTYIGYMDYWVDQ